MLANTRKIKLNGLVISKTPLLVPSFSSKGFSKEIESILNIMKEFITECHLVSAYDIYYKYFDTSDLVFSEFMFIDSGGYEATKEHELSEIRSSESESYKAKPWSSDMHNEVCEDWLNKFPQKRTILISYDHPKKRNILENQIENANEFFKNKNVIREFLVKPETDDQKYVQIPSVLKNIEALSRFDIIGFTEKELGSTVLERMKNISTIRKKLIEINEETPIHIFGSLDTVLTPLYFIAGADIFDGLTWLRYAFIEGATSYIHHSFPLKSNFSHSEKSLHKVLTDNYYYLLNIQDEFNRFISTDGDFSCFSFHSNIFRKAYQSLNGN